jgi:hypothetical protein
MRFVVELVVLIGFSLLTYFFFIHALRETLSLWNHRP